MTSALLGDFNVPLPASASGVDAESSSNATTQNATLGGSNGEGAGVLGATAASSDGEATATLASLSLPSVVSVNGGRSTATTDIVGGATRQAVGSSTIASVSLLGGLVSLNGLKWTATDSTGAQPVQAGSFTIGSISIGGSLISIPADGLVGVLTTVNKLLASTGLHITLPAQQVGSDGSVQETPLSIGIDNFSTREASGLPLHRLAPAGADAAQYDPDQNRWDSG